jgi:putative peptidoglycan lipid II flippase
VFHFFCRATPLIALANASALVLQFLTTLLVARTFGATAQMDAYALAVSIPESLQYVLMLATLSVVFTPMFVAARAQHGESDAWSMALSLLTLVTGGVVIVIPLLAWAMPGLMALLAPGFAPATRALAVELTRLILPGLIYYATAGLLLGICYAYRDFATAALNTFLVALLNLVAFFVFVLWLEQGVRGMMVGRLLVLFVLEIFLLARTLRWKRVTAKIQLRQPRVWHVLTYLPPYMFGALSGQLEWIVNRALISTLGAGSVAAWGYGQRLAEIPLAVLGSAIGTTYLPEFATQVAEGKNAEASAQWNRTALRVSLVLAPIAAFLIALGTPFIALLFQRGAFDAAATHSTALVLAGLAFGLPWRGIGGLIVRGLPAFQTRRLPLLLSALSSGASIVLAFALLGVWGAFGVALAASLGDVLFAGIGSREFWRRLRANDARVTLREFFKIIFSATVAGIGAFACAQGIQTMFVGNEIVLFLLQVVVGAAVGLMLFGATGWLLNIARVRAQWRAVGTRIHLW